MQADPIDMRHVTTWSFTDEDLYRAIQRGGSEGTIRCVVKSEVRRRIKANKSLRNRNRLVDALGTSDPTAHHVWRCDYHPATGIGYHLSTHGLPVEVRWEPSGLMLAPDDVGATPEAEAEAAPVVRFDDDDGLFKQRRRARRKRQ